jgi:transposase-like protein
VARRAEVVLSDEDREVLERWARRPKSSQAWALRRRIVLAAAGGVPSVEIARRLGCTKSTVGKWRGRFSRLGFDGLHDEPPPGKPRVIGCMSCARADAWHRGVAVGQARRGEPAG